MALSLGVTDFEAAGTALVSKAESIDDSEVRKAIRTLRDLVKRSADTFRCQLASFTGQKDIACKGEEPGTAAAAAAAAADGESGRETHGEAAVHEGEAGEQEDVGSADCVQMVSSLRVCWGTDWQQLMAVWDKLHRSHAAQLGPDFIMLLFDILNHPMAARHLSTNPSVSAATSIALIALDSLAVTIVSSRLRLLLSHLSSASPSRINAALLLLAAAALRSPSACQLLLDGLDFSSSAFRAISRSQRKVKEAKRGGGEGQEGDDGSSEKESGVVFWMGIDEVEQEMLLLWGSSEAGGGVEAAERRGRRRRQRRGSGEVADDEEAQDGEREEQEEDRASWQTVKRGRKSNWGVKIARSAVKDPLKAPTRVIHWDFVLSLIIAASRDVFLLSSLLCKRSLFAPLFRHLHQDHPITILKLLAVVDHHVTAQEAGLPSHVQASFFSDSFLLHLIAISAWQSNHSSGQERRHSQDPTAAAASSALRLLQSLLSDSRHGLLPEPLSATASENQKSDFSPASPVWHSPPASPSSPTASIRRLLSVLKELRVTRLPPHRSLFVAAVSRCPLLAPPLLHELPFEVEPSASDTWFAAISSIGELIAAASSLPLPKPQSTEASVFARSFGESTSDAMSKQNQGHLKPPFGTVLPHSSLAATDAASLLCRVLSPALSRSLLSRALAPHQSPAVLLMTLWLLLKVMAAAKTILTELSSVTLPQNMAMLQGNMDMLQGSDSTDLGPQVSSRAGQQHAAAKHSVGRLVSFARSATAKFSHPKGGEQAIHGQVAAANRTPELAESFRRLLRIQLPEVASLLLLLSNLGEEGQGGRKKQKRRGGEERHKKKQKVNEWHRVDAIENEGGGEKGGEEKQGVETREEGDKVGGDEEDIGLDDEMEDEELKGRWKLRDLLKWRILQLIQAYQEVIPEAIADSSFDVFSLLPPVDAISQLPAPYIRFLVSLIASSENSANPNPPRGVVNSQRDPSLWPLFIRPSTLSSARLLQHLHQILALHVHAEDASCRDAIWRLSCSALLGSGGFEGHEQTAASLVSLLQSRWHLRGSGETRAEEREQSTERGESPEANEASREGRKQFGKAASWKLPPRWGLSLLLHEMHQPASRHHHNQEQHHHHHHQRSLASADAVAAFLASAVTAVARQLAKSTDEIQRVVEAVQASRSEMAGQVLAEDDEIEMRDADRDDRDADCVDSKEGSKKQMVGPTVRQSEAAVPRWALATASISVVLIRLMQDAIKVLKSTSATFSSTQRAAISSFVALAWQQQLRDVEWQQQTPSSSLLLPRVICHLLPNTDGDSASAEWMPLISLREDAQKLLTKGSQTWLLHAPAAATAAAGPDFSLPLFHRVKGELERAAAAEADKSADIRLQMVQAMRDALLLASPARIASSLLDFISVARLLPTLLPVIVDLLRLHPSILPSSICSNAACYAAALQEASKMTSAAVMQQNASMRVHSPLEDDSERNRGETLTAADDEVAANKSFLFDSCALFLASLPLDVVLHMTTTMASAAAAASPLSPSFPLLPPSSLQILLLSQLDTLLSQGQQLANQQLQHSKVQGFLAEDAFALLQLCREALEAIEAIAEAEEADVAGRREGWKKKEGSHDGMRYQADLVEVLFAFLEAAVAKLIDSIHVAKDGVSEMGGGGWSIHDMSDGSESSSEFSSGGPILTHVILDLAQLLLGSPTLLFRFQQSLSWPRGAEGKQKGQEQAACFSHLDVVLCFHVSHLLRTFLLHHPHSLPPVVQKPIASLSLPFLSATSKQLLLSSFAPSPSAPPSLLSFLFQSSTPPSSLPPALRSACLSSPPLLLLTVSSVLSTLFTTAAMVEVALKLLHVDGPLMTTCSHLGLQFAMSAYADLAAELAAVVNNGSNGDAANDPASWNGLKRHASFTTPSARLFASPSPSSSPSSRFCNISISNWRSLFLSVTSLFELGNCVPRSIDTCLIAALKIRRIALQANHFSSHSMASEFPVFALPSSPRLSLQGERQRQRQVSSLVPLSRISEAAVRGMLLHFAESPSLAGCNALSLLLKLPEARQLQLLLLFKKQLMSIIGRKLKAQGEKQPSAKERGACLLLLLPAVAVMTVEEEQESPSAVLGPEPNSSSFKRNLLQALPQAIGRWSDLLAGEPAAASLLTSAASSLTSTASQPLVTSELSLNPPLISSRRKALLVAAASLQKIVLKLMSSLDALGDSWDATLQQLLPDKGWRSMVSAHMQQLTQPVGNAEVGVSVGKPRDEKLRRQRPGQNKSEGDSGDSEGKWEEVFLSLVAANTILRSVADASERGREGAGKEGGRGNNGEDQVENREGDGKVAEQTKKKKKNRKKQKEKEKDREQNAQDGSEAPCLPHDSVLKRAGLALGKALLSFARLPSACQLSSCGLAVADVEWVAADSLAACMQAMLGMRQDDDFILTLKLVATAWLKNRFSSAHHLLWLRQLLMPLLQNHGSTKEPSPSEGSSSALSSSASLAEDLLSLLLSHSQFAATLEPPPVPPPASFLRIFLSRSSNRGHAEESFRLSSLVGAVDPTRIDLRQTRQGREGRQRGLPSKRGSRECKSSTTSQDYLLWPVASACNSSSSDSWHGEEDLRVKGGMGLLDSQQTRQSSCRLLVDGVSSGHGLFVATSSEEQSLGDSFDGDCPENDDVRCQLARLLHALISATRQQSKQQLNLQDPGTNPTTDSSSSSSSSSSRRESLLREAFALLLAAYTGSRSHADVSILSLLREIEAQTTADRVQQGLHLEEFGFCFGPCSAGFILGRVASMNESSSAAAVGTKMEQQLVPAVAAAVERVASKIDARRCALTVLFFGATRKQQTQLEAAAASPPSNLHHHRKLVPYLFVNSLNADDANGRNNGADISSEVTSLETILQFCYDPNFLMPAALFFLRHRLLHPLAFSRKGLLAVALRCLAAADDSLRSSAYAVMATFTQLLDASAPFKEQPQLDSILRFVRSSISQPLQHIPPLSSLLAAELSWVLLNPSSLLFPAITAMLVKQPSLDLEDLPFFLSFLHANKASHDVLQCWLLHLLFFGSLQGDMLALLRRRYIPELVLSLAQSSVANQSLRELAIVVHAAMG